MNAVNVVMCEEVTRCLVEASSDPRTRVVIVTGAGERAFSAGADIKEEKEHTALGMYAFAGTGQRMCETMERCQRPVIAAIRGYALGGGMELALACDFRVAAEDARARVPGAGPRGDAWMGRDPEAAQIDRPREGQGDDPDGQTLHGRPGPGLRPRERGLPARESIGARPGPGRRAGA